MRELMVGYIYVSLGKKKGVRCGKFVPFYNQQGLSHDVTIMFLNPGNIPYQ